MKYLRSLFAPKLKKKPTTDFSDFFYNASEEEKKKLFREVAREAAQDQQKIIDEYNRLNPKTI